MAICVAFCAAPWSIQAAEPRNCSLPVAETVVVASVGEGALIALQDRRTLRLVNILLEPGDARIAQTLSALMANKNVSLAFDERAIDRNRNLVAHVFADSGKLWIQETLIKQGLARVNSWPDTRRCVEALLVLERQARKAKLGIWSQTRYRVRRPGDLANDIGTFQIVEGVVHKVSVGRNRTYINFGENYRTDFTITISKRDLKRFTAAGIDPTQWQGKPLRVRGWVSLLNGPEIEATHPEQIEIPE